MFCRKNPCGSAGIFTVFSKEIGRIIPPMPYGCGAILGIGLSALCALSVIGCLWFFAFLRQTFRAYKRFHQNAPAPGRGAAALPALSVIFSFSPNTSAVCAPSRWCPSCYLRFVLCFPTSYAPSLPDRLNSGTYGDGFPLDFTATGSFSTASAASRTPTAAPVPRHPFPPRKR